jgi:hypothetical protein
MRGISSGTGDRPDHRQPAVAAADPLPSLRRASGWQLSGTGPDYESTQTIPNTIPGGPDGPSAGHTLQFVASLISQGAQIVTIRQSDPFVLV